MSHEQQPYPIAICFGMQHSCSLLQSMQIPTSCAAVCTCLCACPCPLQPGHHTFRFLLNAQQQEPGVFQPMAGMLAQASPAQYAVLQHLPLETLPSGVTANSLRVPAPPTFRLLYHTNFSEAYITYRFSGQQVRRQACALQA
jgi:hypothetical protein